MQRIDVHLYFHFEDQKSEEIIQKSAETDQKPKDKSHIELMNLWNTHCGYLPKCKVLSARRTKAAKARLKEHPNLDEWKVVIQKIAKSDWCNARHSKNLTWKATFDYLVKPDTFSKVIEGLYDGDVSGHVEPSNLSDFEFEI